MRERLLSFAQRFNPEAELEPVSRVYPDMSRCTVRVGDRVMISLSASDQYPITHISVEVYRRGQHLVGVWGVSSDDLLEKILRTAIEEPQP